jgi:hypothetical protein
LIADESGKSGETRLSGSENIESMDYRNYQYYLPGKPEIADDSGG